MTSPSVPLGSWKFTRAQVAQCCLAYGPFLNVSGVADAGGRPLDPVLVMWAFAQNESILEDGGAIFSCPPRFEPAYWEGGRYADPKKMACRYQVELNIRFGKDGAKSYGCWQVMLCNTSFKPEDFTRVEIGAQAFIAYVNGHRMMAGDHPPRTLREMGDVYNSGNWRDGIVPLQYMDRLERHYDVPMPEIWNPA